jgi:hypothetical protein
MSPPDRIAAECLAQVRYVAAANRVSRELRLLLSAAIDQLFFFTTTTFQLPGPWTKTTLFFTRNIKNTNHN